MKIRSKKIVVVGLGKSGFEAAKFLRAKGACVLVSEREQTPFLKQKAQQLQALDIEVELGKHRAGLFRDAEWAIFSPGISPCESVFREASAQLGQRLLSEIELAFRFCPAEIIAVTGTNGKSSVTAWAAALLNALGHPAIACGNIGNPFIGEVSKLNSSIKVIVEVSSFQLANIRTFRPHIGVLLNITPDHFDWHEGWNDYVRAKARLFENQNKADYAFINFQDMAAKKIAAHISSKVVYFNCDNTPNPNYDIVLGIAEIYGINRDIAWDVLKKLPPLPHRLEPVQSCNGVRYIDDSKATNPASLAWALKKQSKAVILLCGGRDKGGDFQSLRGLIGEKVKYLILFGESKHTLEKTWKDIVPVKIVDTLKEAVCLAYQTAEKGDTVLLSPACASFDQFKDYKHRGEMFKAYVEEYSSASHSSCTVARDWP